jgi:signal recognition particle receptor subunit beta
MQMAAKIVYYGPGLCGKTSNLSYIYAKTTPNSRGEMVSLETESDRTLFFDLLPIEVGTIGGFKTRLQLYTVPGQVFYNTTRKLVLKGVDGLVFVADSQRPMREANIESLSSLIENLEDLGLEMSDLPLVLQYNKRDLKNILTVDELNSDLNAHSRHPHFPASAINGDGVFETLKEITKLTLKKLRKRMASSQPGGISPAAVPVRPAMQPRRPESISAASLARAAEEGVVSDAEPVRPRVPAKPPTMVAPPMPGPAPPSSASDVFSTPAEPIDQPEAEGPLDGGSFPSTEIPASGPVLGGANAPEAESGAQLHSRKVFDETPTDLGIGREETLEVADAVETISFDSEPDPAENVDFGQHGAEEPIAELPPVKRVHVSNQLDILAELEGLRSGSFVPGTTNRNRSSATEIDIDSLISGVMGGTKEIRRKVEQGITSGIFDRMRGLQIAIQVKNADGETIQTLDPVVVEVDGTGELNKLSIRFAIDLNHAR